MLIDKQGGEFISLFYFGIFKMKLKTKYPAVIVILCILLFMHLSSTIALADKAEDEILSVTEGFFIALKERRFADAWDLLTVKSKNTIIDEVYKDINKTKTKMGREVVKEEFQKKGELFDIFWNNFIKKFDPDTVLEQSAWNIGRIESDRATLILRYKRSEYDSELQIYKEEGKWKFGLVESYWTRK